LWRPRHTREPTRFLPPIYPAACKRSANRSDQFSCPPGVAPSQLCWVAQAGPEGIPGSPWPPGLEAHATEPAQPAQGPSSLTDRMPHGELAHDRDCPGDPGPQPSVPGLGASGRPSTAESHADQCAQRRRKSPEGPCQAPGVNVAPSCFIATPCVIE